MSHVETPLPLEYAIFASGGKQYQAIPGKTVALEKLEGENGSKVEFKALFTKKGDKYTVGQPEVPGVTIIAEILKQDKGEKIIVYKCKRRKKYRVKNGHRQLITIVRVLSI